RRLPCCAYFLADFFFSCPRFFTRRRGAREKKTRSKTVMARRRAGHPVEICSDNSFARALAKRAIASLLERIARDLGGPDAPPVKPGERPRRAMTVFFVLRGSAPPRAKPFFVLRLADEAVGDALAVAVPAGHPFGGIDPPCDRAVGLRHVEDGELSVPLAQEAMFRGAVDIRSRDGARPVDVRRECVDRA